MQATQQQVEILDTYRGGKDLVVKARAGTGKTQEVEWICRDHLQSRILLLCFNRGIADSAKTRMPANTTCKTFHGLGWPTYGKHYTHRAKWRFQHWRYMQSFGAEERTVIVARETVRRFTASDDQSISYWHVPKRAYFAMKPEDRQGFIDEVVMVARKLWLRKVDRRDEHMPVEFDDWLKMFQLENDYRESFDHIIVDEAQDITPRDLALIQRMTGQKLLVGDDFQQLFGWRGTIDSLDQVNIPDVRFLTQSFRFGEKIAEQANAVLALLLHKTPPLVGLSSKQDQVLYDNQPTGRHTILCRTNAGLLTEVQNAVGRKKSIHVIGNLADAINQLESAWYLSIGEKSKVRHPSLTLFEDWEALTKLISVDMDMKMLAAQVEKYNSAIPSLCTEIREAGELPAHKADVILTTVHKAKGLQWPTVKLSNDFPKELVYFSTKDRRYKAKTAEIYTLYVALTRAEETLYANSTLGRVKGWLELLVDL